MARPDPKRLKREVFAAYDRLYASRGLAERPQQRQMIEAVVDTLSAADGQTRILAVEGPTGTGKTVAYLLGTIPVARALGKKVVVATATVALQEQLVHRDIPDLQAHSGLDFSCAIALGRGRFVCTTHLEQLAGDDPRQGTLLADDPLPALEPLWRHKPSEHELATVRTLLERWQARTWDGCRDTLEEAVSDRLWPLLTTDAHRCIGKRCSNAFRCPFLEARRGLHDADVVVANHDLVLADVAAEAGILPDLEESFVVFDEGHHLPHKAIRQFQARLLLGAFAPELERLGKQLLAAAGELPEPGDAVQRALGEVPAQVAEAVKAAHALDRAVRQLELPVSDGGEALLRMPLGVLPEVLVELAANLRGPVEELRKAAETLRGGLNKALNKGRGDIHRLEGTMPAVGFAAGRLQAAADLLRYLAQPDPADSTPHARWFRRVGDDISAEASPITAAPLLRGRIWSRAAGAVITSATLTALGKFDRLARSCGLNQKDGTRFLKLASPFDYRGKAELVVAYMEQEPQAQAAFLNEVAAQLPRRIDPDEGTLVLFTARRAMEQVAEALPERLRMQLRMQGRMGKQALLEAHHKAIDNGRGSILFGLASMAEGVDLKGAYCRHVVIVKLPFAVPDSPVEATQAEFVEAKGGNPFMRLAVPDASLKLIQACGRLLRTEQDYGRVTVFDRRIVTRRYGKMLLDALPPFRVVVEGPAGR